MGEGIDMGESVTTFSFPTTIYFGPGAIGKLPLVLGELGIDKPLVVTDEGLKAAGIVDRALSPLKKEGGAFSLFSGVHANPTVKDAQAGAAAYEEQGCDGLMALGGGSPLDAAKAIAVLAANPGPLTRYDVASGGSRDIGGELPALIAVPTTAGTGSEVGRCAVISSSELGRKFMVCHPSLMPARAILDPELTAGLPALLTAATGMDALTHNIEALTVEQFHPMCDAIAVKGVEMVAQYLERAVKSPNDIEARGQMMMAATMGAVAFQKALGAAHSMAHALSAVCGMQHGLANAICLPAVMRFNRETSAAQYRLVARGFGIPVEEVTVADAAGFAINAVEDLIRRIGLPATLRQAGVEPGQLPALAQKASEDGCHATNPRPCSEEDFKRLFEEVF